MLNKLFTLVKNWLKYLIGWPRPVYRAKFKTGDMVWYKPSDYFGIAPLAVQVGYVAAVKTNRSADTTRYIVKSKPKDLKGIWIDEEEIVAFEDKKEE